jgi:hypothetical protein
MRVFAIPAILVACLLSGSATAATLIHDYQFSDGVTDSAGSSDGWLSGAATVSGGKLILNGGFAGFDEYLLPSSGAFSLYVSFVANSSQGYYTEMVSQGNSGQPGFYLGIVGDDIRLTDNYAGGIGQPFPKDNQAHDILLTTGNGTSQVFVDGASVWSAVGNVNPGSTGGAHTVFGGQFGGGWESFIGSIDTVRIFDGVATYSEATAGGVPEPASWAMMLGGFGLIGAAMRRRQVRVRFA